MKKLLQTIAAEQGWSQDTQIELLCRYAANLFNTGRRSTRFDAAVIVDFRKFLDAVADEEEELVDEMVEALEEGSDVDHPKRHLSTDDDEDGSSPWM